MLNSNESFEVNQAFGVFFYLWGFPIGVNREPFLPQARGVTLDAAGENGDQPSALIDNPPVSNMLAGVLGNRLKRFLGRHGTRALNLELIG